MADIAIKRIYEAPSKNDGQRILVDRLWPRGVSKDVAKLDAWMKDIAPSSALRKQFCHDAERWEDFKTRYFRELDANQQHVAALKKLATTGKVTLLYGSKDEQHNQAVALKEYLSSK